MFEKRKKVHVLKNIGKLEKFIRFIFNLISKNPSIYFKKQLSLQNIQIGNWEEGEFQMSKISEKIQEKLLQLIKNHSKGNLENTFCLYNTVISRVTMRERVICTIFEILKSLIIVVLLSLIHLGFKEYDILLDHKILTGFLMISSCLIFVGKEILARKVLGYKNTIFLIRRQGLHLMIYHKLSISDSYLLSKSDNNLVYRLFYSESDAFSKSFKTLNGIPPMIILNIFLCIVIFSWPNGIFHWIQLSIVGRNILCSFLIIWKSHLMSEHKSNAFKTRKTLYEMICNFKAIRASNLSQKCLETINKVTQKKTNILRNVHLINSVLYFFAQYWFTSLIISLPYLIALCFYPEYQKDDYDLKKNVDKSLLGFVPTTRQILGTLFIEIFIGPFLRSHLEELEADIDCRYANQLFDRFFSNDLIIEPPVAESENMDPGGIIIDNCQVLEREFKLAHEIINSILENSETDCKPRLDNDSQLRDKVSFKISSKTIRFTKELTVLNNKASLLSSGRKKRIDTPIRLRQLFSNLNMEISPGAKLCIYNNNQTESVSGFMKILCGDTVIREGNLFITGRCFYYNPNKMSFLTGSTIQDNIIYGADYNADRYRHFLRLLNLNFDAYHGRDFYQVTRRGENLKLDDRRMIMLARMLYSESDIYIIEDLLNESSCLMVLGLIKSLFKNALSSKTIIYNSNIYQFMDLSTQILQFETKEKFWVFKTNQFREIYLNSKKNNKNQIDDGKQIILQSKIKNSLFITSTGYEEEIAIHKQLKSQMEEIEKFKQENRNIVDQLVHGILLTQKRRTEGTNLLEIGNKKMKSFSVYYLKQLMKYSFKSTLLCLISSLASCAFFYLFEWHIVFPENGSDADKWQAKSFSRKRITEVSVYFLLYQLFHWVKVFSYRYASQHTGDLMLKNTLTKLENASAAFIDKLSPPTVLAHISEDIDELHRNFSMVALGLLDGLLDILVCSTILSVANSVALPIFWSIFGIVPSFFITERITLGYQNLERLREHYVAKLNRFHYHLLQNMPSYRINKRTGKMDHVFTQLNDSLVAVERQMQCVLGLLTSTLNVVELYIFLTFMSTVVLNDLVPTFNFFKTDRLFYSYTVVLCCRLVSQIKNFRIILYFKQANLTTRFKKMVEFSEQLDKNQREVQSRTWKKLEFEETASIIFKNVGLTLGYRPVLKKVTFKVKALDRFGIVGVDGVGRKSIFQILTGAKTIDENPKSKVTVFGLQLDEIDKKLYQQILLILPSPILLEGSVKSNIDPYQRSSDAKIVELLKIFNLEGFFRQDSEDDAEILEIEKLSPINWMELGLLSEKPQPKPEISAFRPTAREPQPSDRDSKSRMTLDKLMQHEDIKSGEQPEQVRGKQGWQGVFKAPRCSTMFVKRSPHNKPDSGNRLHQPSDGLTPPRDRHGRKNSRFADSLSGKAIDLGQPISPRKRFLLENIKPELAFPVDNKSNQNKRKHSQDFLEAHHDSPLGNDLNRKSNKEVALPPLTSRKSNLKLIDEFKHENNLQVNFGNIEHW